MENDWSASKLDSGSGQGPVVKTGLLEECAIFEQSSSAELTLSFSRTGVLKYFT